MIFTFCFVSLSFAKRAQYNDYTKVGDNPLIIVHANPLFNNLETGKFAMDSIIKDNKLKGREIYYLYSNRAQVQGIESWYVADKSPTKSFFSFEGENNLINSSSEFSIAGGYLGSDNGFGCMTGTLIALVSNHFTSNQKKQIKQIKLNIHLAASYTYGQLGWQKSLYQFYIDNDDISFLSFLMSTQPSQQTPYAINDNEQYPIDMEKLIHDDGSYRSGSLDFWNLFIKLGHDNWAMAGVVTEFAGVEQEAISTKNGYKFIIKLNGETIAYLGTGSKQVNINFIP